MSAPEVIDEVQVASPVVTESKTKPEDMPKKTFASIVSFIGASLLSIEFFFSFFS